MIISNITCSYGVPARKASSLSCLSFTSSIMSMVSLWHWLKASLSTLSMGFPLSIISSIYVESK